MAPNTNNASTETVPFTKDVQTAAPITGNTLTLSDANPVMDATDSNSTTGRGYTKEPEVARRGKHAGGYGTPGAFGKSKFKW